MASTIGNDGGYTNPTGDVQQFINFSKPCGGNEYTVTFFGNYLEMKGPLGKYTRIDFTGGIEYIPYMLIFSGGANVYTSGSSSTSFCTNDNTKGCLTCLERAN